MVEKAERRKFRRISVSFIVIYEIGEPIRLQMFVGKRDIYAIMIDLSEAGMAILTTYKLEENSILNIKFTLIDMTAPKEKQTKRINLTGEVRYCILKNKNEYRVGIKFIEITEEDRTAIVDFCKKFSFHI